MNTQENLPAEVRFSSLMKRIRRLGLDALYTENGAASPAQMALVDWVGLNPGHGVQDIADGLHLAPPTISVSVKRMERNGIIERKPDPSDARAVQFFLTPHGQEIHNQHQVYHRKKFKQLLSGLSLKEQETLIELLERALQSAEVN